MVTVGLLGTILVAGLALLMFGLARIWTLEVLFLRVCWIPLAALALEGIFARALTSALSYFAVAVPFITCLASIFLTFIGATLVTSARERGERRAGLLGATVIASVPGALLAAYILYAFLAHWLSNTV